MEQEINIAEKLKGAPEGTKLYTPIYGEVEFSHIGMAQIIHVKTRESTDVSFFPDGKYDAKGECMLFPSKDCRTWENFEAPQKHKHFEPFQKVLVNKGGRDYWYADLYSHYRQENCVLHHACVGGEAYSDDDILPYEGNENLLGKGVE